MPLYDFRCHDCGKESEILIAFSDDKPLCSKCGSKNLEKKISAPSSFSGSSSAGLPGKGDTGCCGSSPSSAGCDGPGSCCGKSFP